MTGDSPWGLWRGPGRQRLLAALKTAENWLKEGKVDGNLRRRDETADISTTTGLFRIKKVLSDTTIFRYLLDVVSASETPWLWFSFFLPLSSCTGQFLHGGSRVLDERQHSATPNFTTRQLNGPGPGYFEPVRRDEMDGADYAAGGAVVAAR